MESPASASRMNGAEPTDVEISAVLDRMDLTVASNLIGVLQEVQDVFGYLPQAALGEISRRGHIPLARIHGVISFYSQFYTKPRGKHTILCCRGTACHVKGAKQGIDLIKRELEIEEGMTTPDMMFFLETVACLGACFLAPVMMIDSQYYGMLTPRKVASILKSYRNKEQ